MSAGDRVTVAILAKNMAVCLPLYLLMIEEQTFPKAQTLLYVRTNNNSDNTREILEEWIARVKSQYAEVYFNSEDVKDDSSAVSNHEWTSARFTTLGRIRQASVDFANERGTHYFVSDCDNFPRRDAISTLLETNLPVVGPILRCMEDCRKFYSNYHHKTDQWGYLKPTDSYSTILHQTVTGLIEVDVIHCTYFIRKDILRHVCYQDSTSNHEYVIFSRTLREKNIQQYIDTRGKPGFITFATTPEQLAIEQIPQLVQPVLNTWDLQYLGNCGSTGQGSTREFMDAILPILCAAIKTSVGDFKSLVDVGCGDGLLTTMLQSTFPQVSFTGVDVSSYIITKAIQMDKDQKVKWILADAFSTSNIIPRTDVLLLKDVLQHIPNAEVTRVIPLLLERARVIITINCDHQPNDSYDTPVGGFRPLNPHMLPLKKFSPTFHGRVNGKSILSISH